MSLLVLLSTGCGFKPKPPVVTGTPTKYGVQVNWSAVPEAVSYQVFRETDLGFVVIGTPATPGYLDPNVKDGETYSYYVEAVDENGTPSDPSNTASVVIPRQ